MKIFAHIKKKQYLCSGIWYFGCGRCTFPQLKYTISPNYAGTALAVEGGFKTY